MDPEDVEDKGSLTPAEADAEEEASEPARRWRGYGSRAGGRSDVQPEITGNIVNNRGPKFRTTR